MRDRGQRRSRRFAAAVGVIVVYAALWLPRPSEAIPTIEFGILPQFSAVATGDRVVSYDGEGGPLVGNNIRVSTITGTGTPLNDGVSLACLECTLDFETGDHFLTLGPFTLFMAGGWVMITGGVALPLGIEANSTLLDGSFTPALLTVETAGAATNLDLALGMVDDLKHPLLTAFFGMPSSGYVADFRLLFTSPDSFPGPVTSGAILAGSLTNTVAVAEPGSLSLLLAGFGAIAVAHRVRRRAQ